MPKINQLERARLAWDVLIQVARTQNLITYKGLGDRIGVHHRAIRYVLGPIQDYCMEAVPRLPPLTILVVNGSGLPGTGFIAHDANDLDGGLESVRSFDWQAVQNPFDFAAEGLSYPDLIKTLTQNPDDAASVYTKVRSRGVLHLLFRDAVRKAYGWTCAFTGMQFEEALHACHIVPWTNATPQQRMDVRNGVLLNPLHHRLFDAGKLTFSVDYRVLYNDPKGKERKHSQLEAALSIKLHNQAMHVPRLLKLRPLPEYLAQHNEIVGWKAS